MRNKTFLLAIAGVCGSIAAVAVNQWMHAHGGGGGDRVQTVEIFVAVKDIDVSEQLTAENIKLEEWPIDRVPEGALNKLEELEGKYANQRLFTGEPLMQRKLMDSASNTGLKIPKGFSVVSMASDAASGVGNLVRPGDRVNVIGFFQKSDVIPQTMTQTVLSGVRVFAVDGRTVRSDEEESGKAARTISLLIHKKDEEAWTYASELGKVRLTLGRPDDDGSLGGDASGPNAAGQQFLQWLADYQKARDARQPQQTLATQAPAGHSEPAATAPADEPAQFTMLKMGADGQLSVFEFSPAGVPVVVQSSGDGGPQPEAAPPVANDEAADSERPTNEYSYLNGSASPLFEDRTQRAETGDKADADEDAESF